MPLSTKPAVLLVTHSRDVFTIDRVAAAVERLGARPVRFDTDRFPGEVTLSMADRGGKPCYLLRDGDVRVSDDEVAAVWTRSLWPPAILSKMGPEHRRACFDQSRELLKGFLEGFAGVRWISRAENLWESQNKVRQTRLARAAGLVVPPTLITNDPDEVRRFYTEMDGRVVTKLLSALSFSMDRSGPFLPTRDVLPEDLEHLAGLRFAPMIFQRKVEKERELRVKYVDGRLFAGAIDARRTAAGGTDWRLAEAGEAPWTHAEVPDDVAAGLDRLMAALGLAAGAVDLIVTPEGEHVFLEVNPLGEWGMLERDLGLPISRAIAEALTG